MVSVVNANAPNEAGLAGLLTSIASDRRCRIDRTGVSAETDADYRERSDPEAATEHRISGLLTSITFRSSEQCPLRRRISRDGSEDGSHPTQAASQHRAGRTADIDGLNGGSLAAHIGVAARDGYTCWSRPRPEAATRHRAGLGLLISIAFRSPAPGPPHRRSCRDSWMMNRPQAATGTLGYRAADIDRPADHRSQSPPHRRDHRRPPRTLAMYLFPRLPAMPKAGQVVTDGWRRFPAPSKLCAQLLPTRVSPRIAGQYLLVALGTVLQLEVSFHIKVPAGALVPIPTRLPLLCTGVTAQHPVAIIGHVGGLGMQRVGTPQQLLGARWNSCPPAGSIPTSRK